LPCLKGNIMVEFIMLGGFASATALFKFICHPVVFIMTQFLHHKEEYYKLMLL
jgi:hypothetical protein